MGSFPLTEMTPGLLPQSNQREARLAVFIPLSKIHGGSGYRRLLSWGSFAPIIWTAVCLHSEGCRVPPFKDPSGPSISLSRNLEERTPAHQGSGGCGEKGHVYPVSALMLPRVYFQSVRGTMPCSLSNPNTAGLTWGHDPSSIFLLV